MRRPLRESSLVFSHVAVFEEVVLLLFNGIAVRSLLAPRSLDHDSLLLAQSIVLFLEGKHLLIQLRNSFCQPEHFWTDIRSSSFRLNETLFPFFRSVPFPHLSLTIFKILHTPPLFNNITLTSKQDKARARARAPAPRVQGSVVGGVALLPSPYTSPANAQGVGCGDGKNGYTPQYGTWTPWGRGPRAS